MIFEVVSPILGFENIVKMKLEKIDDLFMSLKNIDSPTPSFTLANPFAIRDYRFTIPVTMKKRLNILDGKQTLIANIIVLQDPIEYSTINFLAPLIFNVDDLVMGQIVLESMQYPNYSLAEPIKNYYKEKPNV